MMMIFIQPNNPNTSAAFVKPRSATAEADPVTVSDLETPTPPLEEKETTDTFTLTQKPKKTETDNTQLEEDETTKEKQPTQKTEKSKASALERRKRMKALEEAEKKESRQEGLDNQELHDAKVSASWWASIPLLVGPIIGLVSNVFTSPEAEAKKRSDVRYKDRDIDEATEQEKKIKGAKLKAAFVTAVPQLLGLATSLIIIPAILGRKQISNQEEAIAQLGNPLRWLGALIGTTCILAPLGYQFGEKPEDPEFNQKL